MSLLQDIQAALLEDSTSLNSILLKLKFLAAKLGSEPLEEWVRHEMDGYAETVEVPSYRVIAVQYTGTFFGPFQSGIKNAPIPPALINKYAGEHWTNFQCRQSIAATEALLADSPANGQFEVPAGNLPLLLEGKIYPQFSCNHVSGKISGAALLHILSSVRSRILDLTLNIEKEIPSSVEVVIKSSVLEQKEAQKVSKITNQVIYGNYTDIKNSGSGSHFTFNITQGNTEAVVRELSEQGIASSDAQTFAQLLTSENPENNVEPFGEKTRAWLSRNLSKATDGTWTVGIAVATNLFTEAALKYYGLK